MDGNYLGDTPLFVDGLEAGRHYLTLTRAGWQPQSTAVDVVSGHVASVNAVLTSNAPQSQGQSRAKGALTVRGAAGAKVFLDGVELTPPLEGQAEYAGDHILLVQRGQTRTTTSIRIYPQTTTTISLSPRSPSSGQTGEADMLAALSDYVPPNDFSVSGDEIAIHHNGIELECSVGSKAYVLNGRPGILSVAPEMVGGKPYLPLSLLQRLNGTNKQATR